MIPDVRFTSEGRLDADLRIRLVAQPLDQSTLTGALRLEAQRVRFDASAGATAFCCDSGGGWVALVGVGDPSAPAALRRGAWHAIQLARTLRASSVSIEATGTVLTTEAAASCLAEGLLLSVWRFERYKTPPGDDERATRAPELERVVVHGSPDRAAAFERGLHLGQAVCLARDVANEHPGVCTPEWLADQARALAERHGMACTVLDAAQLEEQGHRLHLAVGRGSAAPPTLAHLTWSGGDAPRRRIAIVGKGVTFDSGGYSLKPAAGQIDMHLDMGGAAAVLGAAEAVGRLRPSGIEIHFIVPAAENMVSGDAYRVNEIIRARNGVTVEIHNTDAEGRLLLADALAYAAELGVDTVVDLATLTGSCVVGLGNETAGLFSPDDALAAELLTSGRRTDELIWQLPLVERIDAQLKSPVADVRNVGSRWGGAISAALFLKRFTGSTRWAHIDIAGPAMAESPWEYICRGGTGYGVLLLADWLTSQSG